MEKKKDNFVISIDLTDLTPEMQIEKVAFNPFYEKAFLDRNEKNASEYSQNTTTWE